METVLLNPKTTEFEKVKVAGMRRSNCSRKKMQASRSDARHVASRIPGTVPIQT